MQWERLTVNKLVSYYIIVSISSITRVNKNGMILKVHDHLSLLNGC